MTGSSTAGLGDPYWYEWSVGLTYVVEMLDPDSDIAAVTFQATGIKGLDDVVVRYHNKPTIRIQVKHTRVNDTLSFGDLVERDETGASLLSQLATAWLSAKESGVPCEAYLFTNRPFRTKGSSASLPGGGRYHRPALSEFWPRLKREVQKARTLDDVYMPGQWHEAWTVFRNELQGFSTSEERVAFLASLTIQADQPNLDELERQLVKRLETAFGVGSFQARMIFQSLIFALREWTTSRRLGEEVTLEMAYKAISSVDAPTVGDHEFAPPQPFFPSRRKFVEDLCAALACRAKPVFFLTGPPGAGKTSIVSELANRRDPIIDLRFHAFRPITPDAATLPTDVGRTATDDALWGDLLVQLRRIFVGRLAQHRVPVRNDFLDTNSMRAHVLRLAQVLAKEQGRPTVIAIDGIDHAARAGFDRMTLLKSLVPPDEVPEDICFLIAGQPADAYEQYPLWLRSAHDQVSVWQVPEIQPTDVLEMLQSAKTPLPVDSLESASRLIVAFAAGSTLAAVFAVHEAGFCSDLSELEERLTHRRLADGLSAYYESIWEAAVRPLQTALPFGSDRLAACISLTTERLNGKLLAGIFTDLSIRADDWTEALRMLRPLLTEDIQGFRVTHNDVRVYLTRRMQSQPTKIATVASRMADYYLTEETAVLPRHTGLFNLLRLAGRDSDKAKVFTPRFVMEAWSVDRPMTEIVEQARSAIRSAVNAREWNDLHNVTCALATINQLRNSLVWMGRDDHGKESGAESIPPVLPAEGRVLNPSVWTADVLSATLHDAIRLIRGHQVARASGLMRRWFGGLSPTEVVAMLPKSPIHPHGTADQSELDESVRDMLRLWGRVSLHTGSPWNGSAPSEGHDSAEREADSHVAAAFFGGWLEEACGSKGRMSWAHALKHVRIYYLNDMEACLRTLAQNGRWCEVGYTLGRLGKSRERFSTAFKAQAAVWSLKIGKVNLVESWAKPLALDPFNGLRQINSAHGESVEEVLAANCFVLGWLNPTRPPGGISEDGVRAYAEVYRYSERQGQLSRLLYAAAWAGRSLGWSGEISRLEGLTSPKEFRDILRALLFPDTRRLNELPFNFNSVSAQLLSVLVSAGERMGDSYSIELVATFQEYAQSRRMWPATETVWRTLSNRGYSTLLQEWLVYWVGPNGAVWEEKIASRFNIVERLSILASESGLEHLVKPAQQRLKWGWIGYIGDKEYALSRPLEWFRDLSRQDPHCWRNEGVRLLALSREASRVGDNRLSLSVEAAVATATAVAGAGHLLCLMKARSTIREHQWMPGNSKMLFDGLIGMLESATLTEQELLALWCLGIGALIWQDGYDRCYLADLRRGISEIAKRLGYQLESQLTAIGPTESLAESDSDLYKIPERWFAKAERAEDRDEHADIEKLLAMSPADALDSLQQQLMRQGEYGGSRQWRILVKLVHKIKREHPAQYSLLLERCLSLIRRRQEVYRWTYDSAHRVYEELIPVLSESQRWEIAAEVVNSLDTESTDIFLESAEENLDLLCRLRAQSAGGSETKRGLERLLATHELWIEADGHFPAINRPLLPDDQIKDLPWVSFTAEVLLDLVQSDSSHGVEAALRGLWALMQVDSGIVASLAARWSTFDDQTRSRVLLIAERAASEKTALFEQLKSVVSAEYAGGQLLPRIQAWVALQSFQRRQGQPGFPLKVEGDVHRKAVKSPPIQGLLKVEGQRHGHIISSMGTSAVHSFLRQLSVAVADELHDIEVKVAGSLLVDPVQSSPQNTSEIRPGDMRLHPSPEVDRLMEIIAGEMANGRWQDVAPTRLAQALTYGDDPFILLRSPSPAPGRETWPVDRQLEDLIRQGGVDAALGSAVTAGITSDNMVLAAVLYTYARGVDLEYRVFPTWRPDPSDLAAIQERSTFNGRSFLLYSIDRFEPPVGTGGTSLTLSAGGMAVFPHQHMYVVPSVLWQTQFGWVPSPENPLTWLEHDRPVAWFENLVGPFRNERWEPWFRQPILQRWVCSRSAFDQLKKRLGGYLRVHSDWKTFRHCES